MNELTCRSCGHQGLDLILSLGKMPPANALVAEDQLDQPERVYPLDVVFCSGCSLVQITESIPPEELFTDYPYFSSYSSTLVAHAEEIVDRMVKERKLGPDNLAMEIASNDGYLLQHYVARGVPVLGIDPARNIAPVAEEKGVRTLCDFFGVDLAEKLRAEGTRADVLHANNVLAHVPDVNGVVRGIGRILTDEGVSVIETPYVRDLVEHLEFDTIYHEHLFYYSLTSLRALYRRNGLDVSHVEWVPIHGGTLRVFGQRSEVAQPDGSVTEMLAEEERLGIPGLGFYRDFADRVEGLKRRLLELLADLKRQGSTIAAYGAAAKGAVLLNAFEIGRETLDFVVDRSPHKQGRYMPGVRIPILPAEALVARMPGYVLLLAWNFADEILEQQSEYRGKGGKFVVPVPDPKVV